MIDIWIIKSIYKLLRGDQKGVGGKLGEDNELCLKLMQMYNSGILLFEDYDLN